MQATPSAELSAPRPLPAGGCGTMWTQTRPSRDSQNDAPASRMPVATQPGPPRATLWTCARDPDPSTIDERQVAPSSRDVQATARRCAGVSAKPPATIVPSAPTATDVMAAMVAPAAPRPIVGLTDQRLPSADAHARGSVAVASVPTATKPSPAAAMAVTTPSSADGTSVAATQLTVSADDQKPTCPVGPPSAVPLSTATTIRSGPIATRAMVAGPAGTATRRQAIPGPGGIVGVEETGGRDGDGSPAVELDGAGGVGPMDGAASDGVTVPQPASAPIPTTAVANTRITRRRALGRPRGRLGIGQG